MSVGGTAKERDYRVFGDLTMKKVLFVSHIANFAKFNYPYMRWFKEQGWQVDYISAGEEEVKDCDTSYTMAARRNPLSPKNLTAYHQLQKIMEQENYDIIHCHTPVGGVLARLAARKFRKNGMKVIYTAHGFHFYKGAPLLNWLIYYPVEKFCASYTDSLVTINEEDYKCAVSKKFGAKQIVKIDGVGVDLQRFCCQPQRKEELRKKYEIDNDAYILICVAEVNRNKDQVFLIENMKRLKEKIPQICLYIVGRGDELERCQELVETSGLQKEVKFWGYRNDIEDLLTVSDVLVSASQREGQPINIIEGMASGIPIVCSDVRGQRDLITSGENGTVYNLGDGEAFCEAIYNLYNQPELMQTFVQNSIQKVPRYSMKRAIENMSVIYKQYMREEK